MPRLLPSGESTTKLAVSVPTSIRAELEREVQGGNLSRYVSKVLQDHFDQLRRNRIHAGAALLAAELDDDVDNNVYTQLRKNHATR